MTKLLVVSDSSSLILAAKSNLLELICMDFLVEIPQKVFEETVSAGKDLQKIDAFIIEKLINEKKIIVKKIRPLQRQSVIESIEKFSLDEGEKQAIILYFQENAQLLLADDKQAINTAKFLGIDWTSVPVIAVELFNRKRISKKSALESLRILQEEGRYRLDFILDAFNEIEKEE